MLRRFLLLLSAVALLVGLCGCAGVEIPFSAEPFTADVMFQSAGTDIKGEITYNSPSDIVFVVKEPENIKGLTFRESKETKSIGIGDVSFTPDAEKESGIYILFDALQAMGESDIYLPASGLKEISVESRNGNCILIFDCADKKLVSAEIKGYSYNFE